MEYTNSSSAKESASQKIIDDSEMLLKQMQAKFQQKMEQLKKLKEENAAMRAAQVLSKKRYREVMTSLKKSGNMVSEGFVTAKRESLRLLDKAKAKARVHHINVEMEESALNLGREVYDLAAMGVGNVFDNANVKKILSKLDEHHVEAELIHQEMAAREADKAKEM